MKKTFYPIVIHSADEGGYIVDVPDLEIGTQGESIPECIEMAREAISMWCICQQDAHQEIPKPSTVSPDHEAGDIVTLVDIDVDAYRRAYDRRTVRRNVSLPSWLDAAAKSAGLNVSAILVSALKSELSIPESEFQLH